MERVFENQSIYMPQLLQKTEKKKKKKKKRNHKTKSLSFNINIEGTYHYPGSCSDISY